MPMHTACIQIRGARQHNLKNINLDIPRDQLTVICGPSGSGKSTLAFDIVYAEGQRRYVESLSTYARQFLPQMDKPDVDSIEGLTPAISLEQATVSRNPRSTVGTVTEVYDFLRVFWARLGIPHCPQCHAPITAQTSDQMVDSILALPEGTRFLLLAPLVEHKKGTHADLLRKLKSQGFARVRVNGEVLGLDPLPELSKTHKHTIHAVVDRLVLRPDLRRRLADSVELALRLGEGRLAVQPVGPDGAAGEDILFSATAVCPRCAVSLPSMSPQLFSFNSPQGACPRCGGIGSIEFYDPQLMAPNTGMSIADGALLPWRHPKALSRIRPDLERLGRALGFTLNTPLSQLSPEAWQALFHGHAPSAWTGLVPLLERGHHLGGIWRDELSRFRQSTTCPACNGARLRPEALAVLVDHLSIFDFCCLPVERARTWLDAYSPAPGKQPIAEPLVKELRHRLGFLAAVGLDYLTLSRSMSTLSGGEAQRIRLAGQLGSGLVGVTYVLDEPSIGLHPRDNERLIATLRSLQSRGNTVLVVEHDEATIRAADHVIELGPGSGLLGGEIVFAGPPQTLVAEAATLTGKYLRGELTIPRPTTRRRPTGQITLRQVTTNNLQGIDCAFPLGNLVCVTGVSGSGKSSLVIDSLSKHLALRHGLKVDSPGHIGGMEGAEAVERLVIIDQTPIGRTPRSNPATYTKVFDDIRALFAGTKEAKKRGYAPGRFSFNVRGGRCEACQGDGQIRVEMHFLPDIFVTCEVCGGKRYNRETLDILYRGKSIAEVLEMSVAEAKEFFAGHSALSRKLGILEEVGLEYLRLGQSATTLSGGEAQRIKLSRELGKRSLPGTLYILDEPTTGLHIHEVGKLIGVLQTLVDRGASVIVIEHNLDVVAAADHVIDLGPGGGENGGRIIAQGTPEELAANPASITGRFLRPENAARPA